MDGQKKLDILKYHYKLGPYHLHRSQKQHLTNQPICSNRFTQEIQ
jgi:hypothetical protein